MSKWVTSVFLITVMVGASTACASRKYVRTRVGEVNGKVETLTQTVEETQERTRKNEAAITAVDQKAQGAQGAADQARQAATTADSKAVAADSKAAAAGTRAEAAVAKTDEMDKAARRLVYTVVLSEDQGQFKFAKTELPDEAKARLDKLVADLTAEPKAVFFEIEGHTDSIGTKAMNERIGLERAEAVKRYLYEQHQVPLHKMNVISYGMTKPATSNKTRDGRAQNRRVVIKVLS